MRFADFIAAGLLVLGVFTCAATSAVAQDRRVALVVGNAAYKKSPLANPVNDARAMTISLQKLGFEVIERENLVRVDFAKAVREYGERLKGATVGLFYFAGHGIQVRGRNFLIPVDADIAFEDEVAYRSVDVAEILDKMDSARTAVNVLVLDACRNNPFAHSFKVAQSGLAQIDAPTGTLIAFATAPGSVAQDGEGGNGLYTGVLLKHIAAPNVAVEQMFKRVRVDVVKASNNQQVPWESSSLNRDFSFAAGSNAAILNAAAVSTVTSNNTTSDLTLELAFWNEVKNSRNPADYRAYLEQYPTGRFLALAKLRASQPQTTQVVPAQPIEAVKLENSPELQSTQVEISALSPEGLYAVSVIAGHLQWRDRAQNVVIRNTPAFDPAAQKAKQLQFSPDGRWLLLSLQNGSRLVHHLLDVASEQLVWQREATAAVFEAQAPQVLLRSVQGTLETVRLP
jgi:uncharacterized caspase-like protein